MKNLAFNVLINLAIADKYILSPKGTEKGPNILFSCCTVQKLLKSKTSTLSYRPMVPKLAELILIVHQSKTMLLKQIVKKPTLMIAITAVTTTIAATTMIKNLDWKRSPSTTIQQTRPLFGENTKPLQTLSGHSTWIYAVALGSDGKTLASGSYDGTIKIWHLPSGKLIRSIAAHADAVKSLAISPNGKIIVSGGWDDCVKLWDIGNGNLIRSININADDIEAVTFAPDGETLAIGSYSGLIKLWSLKTDTEITTFRHSGPVSAVAFSPDGQIIASGSKNGKLKAWFVKTGTEKYTLAAHSRPIWAIAYSPNGKTLASGSQDRTIKLWEVETGKQIGMLSGHSKAVFSVAFSPDGQTLASGSYDKEINLWQVETQKLLATYKGHTKPVWSVDFSHDGQTLVSGSADETIKVWSAVSVAPSPHQSNVEEKSDVSADEVMEIAKLEDLNQKLYEQINQSWRDAPVWYEDLEYRVRVNIDGAIASYEPMNQSAQDYILETPLPKLVDSANQKAISQKPFALFRVILTPAGVLEVSPWSGWESYSSFPVSGGTDF